ncbi:MAG: hypothetical protein JRJ73_09605 [Deltaproteobacteria bacterium]|nr:hypothetical protein [Deltaproteobacteria bacterium]
MGFQPGGLPGNLFLFHVNQARLAGGSIDIRAIGGIITPVSLSRNKDGPVIRGINC